MRLSFYIIILCCAFGLSHKPANAQKGEKKINVGDVIVLCQRSGSTLLSPKLEGAKIFQDICRNDFIITFKTTTNKMVEADISALAQLMETLDTKRKEGAFLEIKVPTKAKVLLVAEPDKESIFSSAGEDLYEVQLLDGPEKDKTFFYSAEFDQGMIPLFYKGFIYVKSKTGEVTPALLAFERFTYLSYLKALDSGDEDTITALKRNGRLWSVPVNSLGQIVERGTDLGTARIQILSGPMKGRKGWGAFFNMNRASEPQIQTKNIQPEPRR